MGASHNTGSGANKRRDSIKQHFEDYCASTSIHGVKYLGDNGRPIGERLWWLFIFVLSMVGSGFFISKVWTKWRYSPVIVSFSESTTPVWQVPFPAVTLCSETKSKASLFDFREAILSNSSDEIENKNKGDVSLFCDPHVVVKDGAQYANQSTVDFLLQVAPTIEDSIMACRWRNKVLDNCSHIFTRVMTEDGICFTFNMLDSKELFRRSGVWSVDDKGRPSSEGWSLEGGYPAGSRLDTYPNRALNPGTSAALFLILKASVKDFDFYCRGPIQGFKILLHNPAEIPAVGERYFRAPMRQEVLVGVNPEIMTTNEGLRSYEPHVRQCYFPSERYLSHFKIYTQQNCDLECLTNYTLHKCGCVALYMPRDEGTPACGPGSKECVLQAKDELRVLELEEESTSRAGDTGLCDCLPACSSLQYDAAISQADYDFASVVQAYGDNETELEGIVLARLAIFFKDKQFITSLRSELYGSSDFLASCGGVLGLFSGISLLSLAELVYYLTLRFWNNVHCKRQSEADVRPDPVFSFDM